jgi:hypothetical protein
MTRTPSQYVAPSYTLVQRCGAFSLRKCCSTTNRVFQISAVAFSTFLKRFADVPPIRAREGVP